MGRVEQGGRVCMKGGRGERMREQEGWAERRVSRKWPSNAWGRPTCAGAWCVSASRCKRMGRASGDDDMSREGGALVICAEARKLRHELEERHCMRGRCPHVEHCRMC